MASKMDDHDGLLRKSFESLSNGVSRHRFLEKAAKGIFATMAALALGNVGIQTAFATWGSCNCCSTFSSGYQCGGCPSPGGPQQCPSTSYSYGSYTPCTYHNCPSNGYCYYDNGWWSCPCGSKTSYCTDCVWLSNGVPQCNYNQGTVCTCNALV